VLAEMQQQRLHELLIEQVTRAVPVAVGFPETPRLNIMALLHVGRLVLNMSKYLIRLPNTSAKDHQRVRAREGESGFACCADMREMAVFIGSISVWDTIGTLPLFYIEIIALFRLPYCCVMGRKAPR
jgi:hypothetical protein